MATAIYTRTAAGENAVVLRQYELCDKTCRERGWRVDAEFSDFRSYDDQERLKVAVMTRQIQRIVTYSVDRLSRRGRDLLEWLELLTEYDCELYTVHDGPVDTARLRDLYARSMPKR
jgi:DNA invertase Pin-like site-specific DNA recombinase